MNEWTNEWKKEWERWGSNLGFVTKKPIALGKSINLPGNVFLNQ